MECKKHVKRISGQTKKNVAQTIHAKKKTKIIKEPRKSSKFDVLLTLKRQEIMHFIENCTFFTKEKWMWRYFQ